MEKLLTIYLLPIGSPLYKNLAILVNLELALVRWIQIMILTIYKYLKIVF
jgi:hypothetical protein